jgi:tripartite-type tricarboxylate transporter receptor subunit TctC
MTTAARFAALSAVSLSALSLFSAGQAHADSIEEFYRGKAMSMVISTGVGGGYDLGGRVVARHLPKHIPGNPTMVPRNMPGAGHVRATNFMAVQAPRDGTHVATVGNSIALHQIMDGGGIHFDIAKLNWLGSSESSNGAVYVWADTGVKTLDDAKKQEVLLGATGAGGGNLQYPALMNNVLGTKFRVIAGYHTGSDIPLAMERGEVHGRANHSFSSLMQQRADWVKQNKINILVQIGMKPEAGFETIPVLSDLAKNETERAIFRIYSAPIALGRPVLTTPEVPAERIAALRKAFDATMKDSDFLEDARKSRLDVSPVSGIELQKIVEDLVATPPATIQAAKAAVEAKDVLKKSIGGDGEKPAEGGQ